MTTEEVVAAVRERRVRLRLKPDGTVSVRGNRDEMTPLLLRILRLPRHMAEIRRRLAADADRPDLSRPIECRWGGTGRVGAHLCPENGFPVGARDWRYTGAGDDAWRPIPADAKREGRPAWIADDARLAAAAAEWRAKKAAGTLDVRLASDDGGMFAGDRP